MKYYCGFLATPKEGYSKEQIVRILFHSQFDSRYLCTDHQTLVQNNAAFVIDLFHLKSLMIQQDTPQILPGHLLTILIKQLLFRDLTNCILLAIALADILLVFHSTVVPACLSLSF